MSRSRAVGVLSQSVSSSSLDTVDVVSPTEHIELHRR